ncbi:MAG TPA: Gldg family protein [Acidobacteriota bacterium]|nr:Gldg family protein [Acidobacteriota bacterium]HRR25728.1 Gldg family protein [Acidobacteriota bacterium]HRR55600.1 Gldg family protein [Acidobacteriota bacterium]HRV07527.1 Gldg family protein [Acidobacteriota bacterium]
MLRKAIDNFAYLGLVLLFLGLFYWSVTDLWDWKTQVGVYGGTALVLVYLIVNFSQVKTVLTGRTARMGGMALASLILVLGILGLLNFLNYRYHKRVDLSEGRLNALSDQTRKVLQNLDQDVRLIGFFQEETGGRRFQNLAREYRYVSSRVDYEIVDPQREPTRVQEYGITRNGQIVVVGAKKREVLDEATEEKITNAIIKVTREGQKIVYFLTGHGERSLEDLGETGYSSMKSEIEKQNYTVNQYNLAVENKIPEDAYVLVSAGPRESFFPNEVELLEDYLVEGGKFLLLVDPDSNFEADELLARFGVELGRDIVVDASGLGQLFGFGAAAPLAADYADHPITRDLEGTMSIYPGARSVLTRESSDGYSTVELIRTSPQSWAETEIGASEVRFDPGKDRRGPVALAVVATKEVKGRESSEESVQESGAESGGPAEDETTGEVEDAASEAEASRESRLVVFGDSDFASNAYWQISVNGDVFLNTVSWLAEDTDLLSIRPKDPENRSITLTATESRLIFWGTVVVFPLATLIFGIAVWYRRR